MRSSDSTGRCDSLRAKQYCGRLTLPPSPLLQALDCVDGTDGWGDRSMHAFRSPGTEQDCSNNQPVYVLRNTRLAPHPSINTESAEL